MKEVCELRTIKLNIIPETAPFSFANHPSYVNEPTFTNLVSADDIIETAS